MVAFGKALTWAKRNFNLLGIMGALTVATLYQSVAHHNQQVRADSQEAASVEAVNYQRVSVGPSRQTLALELLADSKRAQDLRLTHEKYASIAKIDSEMDCTARRMMASAVDRWWRAGGFHTTATPDFKSRITEDGRALARLRRDAEARIAGLLSSEELERWNRSGRPGALPVVEGPIARP
jgi:hypothetical protein